MLNTPASEMASSAPGVPRMAGAPPAGQFQENQAPVVFQLCELGRLSPTPQAPHQDKGLVKAEVIHSLQRAGPRIS